jgi:hypothetical protein
VRRTERFPQTAGRAIGTVRVVRTEGSPARPNTRPSSDLGTPPALSPAAGVGTIDPAALSIPPRMHGVIGNVPAGMVRSWNQETAACLSRCLTQRRAAGVCLRPTAPQLGTGSVAHQRRAPPSFRGEGGGAVGAHHEKWGSTRGRRRAAPRVRHDVSAWPPTRTRNGRHTSRRRVRGCGSNDTRIEWIPTRDFSGRETYTPGRLHYVGCDNVRWAPIE